MRLSNVLGLQLADGPEAIRDVLVIRTRRRLGKYAELAFKVLDELLDTFFSDGGFLLRLAMVILSGIDVHT